MIEADRKLCTLCEPSSISTRLENIAFAISVLRGKLNREDPDRSNAQSIDKILQESRALDQELMAWRIAVPREWETLSYSAPNDQNQPLEDARSAPASTWNGYSASYPDMAIAKLMNHFRMHSIAIQRIDIRCWRLVAQCRHAERSILELTAAEHVTVAHDSPTHLKAYSAIKTMVDGICASVPFHLETPALKGRKEPGGRKKSSEPSKQLPAGQVGAEAPSSEGPVLRPPKRPAGGCMLQPLVVAYSAPGIPADQKIWILGKALEIGKRVGMDEEMIEKTFDSLAAT